MPRVAFTENLQRHVACPPSDVPTPDGASLRAVLDAYFAERPQARGYVLDEQGALRKHMVVFIAGAQLRDRKTLGDAVPAHAEVWIMQALSGG